MREKVKILKVTFENFLYRGLRNDFKREVRTTDVKRDLDNRKNSVYSISIIRLETR